MSAARSTRWAAIVTVEERKGTNWSARVHHDTSDCRYSPLDGCLEPECDCQCHIEGHLLDTKIQAMLHMPRRLS